MQAIMNMEDNPEEGFDKLQFLISTSVFPAETFPNLIVLYMKYELLHQAADVLAEHPEIGESCSSSSSSSSSNNNNSQACRPSR